LNKRCWYRKSTSLSANHCISRADKTYMACSVTGKSEARWKHETSMWSKLTYIDRNVCWFESQEIPPFHFKTSGNNFDDQKLRASWAGRKLTWWIKHREDLHISNRTAVLVKKNVSSRVPGPIKTILGRSIH
jgi:hypothetical protein